MFVSDFMGVIQFPFKLTPDEYKLVLTHGLKHALSHMTNVITLRNTLCIHTAVFFVKIGWHEKVVKFS